MANVKEKAATRSLQVQFESEPGRWEVQFASVPAELTADELVERVREFVPSAPETPEWMVLEASQTRVRLTQQSARETAAEQESRRAQAKQIVKGKLDEATARAYAREGGIPDGYRWGELRRLYRNVRIVVPVRYSDGVEGTLSTAHAIDVTYKVGSRERFSMRIGPLKVGGAEYPWPGPAEQFKPVELEERFGDQVRGVPEIHWPEMVEIDVPSPEAQRRERAKTEMRNRFIPNKQEALPASELRRMGISEEEIRAIWG